MGSDAPAWTSSLRRTCLLASSALAAGTAAATAVAVWRRARRVVDEDEESGVPLVGQVGASKVIPWSEVTQHNSVNDTWIVIHGNVYDVTQWGQDHPGGQLLLLAFAGRDATEPFETIGHSVLAKREMRKLFLGKVPEDRIHDLPQQNQMDRLKSMSRADTVAEPNSSTRRAILTGGPSNQQLSDSEEVWDLSRGFLPARDPVDIDALNGTTWEVFVELSGLLPALGVTGALRRYLDGSPELQARLLACGDPSSIENFDSEQMERAFGVAGYTMVAYWRSGTLEYSTGVKGGSVKLAAGGSCAMTLDPPDELPAFLAKPCLLMSEALGRPPMIDYASSVLYNWTRIDPNGPISMSNVRCLHRLTGLLDEEWFFKTHVIIEAEAAHAVAAIIGGSRASDDEELLNNLVLLEEALWRVVRACLPIMYERAEDGTPKCSENVFYQILRPLIKSGPLVFSGEGRKNLTGPSGAMSTLLPCVDAALGIPVTSEKLKESLALFEISMPKEHRAFLALLRGQQSIRDRILSLKEQVSEGQHEALKRAFNRCISRVLDFRWQHWQYVKNFVMKPGNISNAVGTGGTTFDFLQQHITDTEQARLTEHSTFNWPESTQPEWPPMKPSASVVQLPTQDFWSVDGKHGLLSREPLCGPEGSWAKDLSPEIRESLFVLWDLATRMPSLVAANGPFWQHCEDASTELAALQDDRAMLSMSEVAREHTMTTLTHIASACVANGQRKPPKCIDRPLQVISRSVGRPPYLNFCELVLCNWGVSMSHGPLVGSPSGLSRQMSEDQPERSEAHLHVWWRFIASPDEEWYRSIHIYMHNEAREVVGAIRVGQVATREQNDMGVVASMEQITAWLDKFCDYFDSYFELKDSRTECIMMRRLEPFIANGAAWEDREIGCWVYTCGSSVLMPAIHAYLGVKMIDISGTESAEADRLAQLFRQQLGEFRISMPQLHRAFLEELERPGTSLRQYCLRRFGSRSRSVEQLHNLEVAYNDALNALIRFLSRRVHLVTRLVPNLAGSFGVMHHEVEESMRRSRLLLLKMRQRVDRCLEHAT